MAVFEAKTGLQKLRRQPKLQTFFEMVLIFEFMRDETKNFRKTVLAARARQKKYIYKCVNDVAGYHCKA